MIRVRYFVTTTSGKQFGSDMMEQSEEDFRSVRDLINRGFGHMDSLDIRQKLHRLIFPVQGITTVFPASKIEAVGYKVYGTD